jgi:hypothetical protein
VREHDFRQPSLLFAQTIELPVLSPLPDIVETFPIRLPKSFKGGINYI